MPTFIESVGIDGPVLAQFVVDVSLKVLLVSVLVWMSTRVLRVQDSAILHRAWAVLLVAMLVMPVLVLIVPRLEIPILPDFSASVANVPETIEHEQPSSITDARPIGLFRDVDRFSSSNEISNDSPAPVAAASTKPLDTSEESRSAENFAAEVATDPAIEPRKTSSLPPGQAIPTMSLTSVVVSIYLFGMLLLLLRLLVGMIKGLVS